MNQSESVQRANVDRIAFLESTIAALRKELASKIAERENEFVDLCDQITKLKEELADNDSAFEHANETVEKLETDLAAKDKRIGELEREKDARIYYQNIVYHACNVLDRIENKKPGAGIVCGTLESPSNEVQEKMDSIQKRISSQSAEIARLRGALKKLEYVEIGAHVLPRALCPACKEFRGLGHKPACWLAALLKEIE